MNEIHDSKIIKYEVDFQKSTLMMELTTYQKERYSIVFKDVLTHIFQNEMTNSIIFNIERRKIEDFIDENKMILKTNKNYGWPIYYKNVEELSKKLRQDNYHYFVINSSYGLNGYVIAKNLIKI